MKPLPGQRDATTKDVDVAAAAFGVELVIALCDRAKRFSADQDCRDAFMSGEMDVLERIGASLLEEDGAEFIKRCRQFAKAMEATRPSPSSN